MGTPHTTGPLPHTGRSMPPGRLLVSPPRWSNKECPLDGSLLAGLPRVDGFTAAQHAPLLAGLPRADGITAVQNAHEGR